MKRTLPFFGWLIVSAGLLGQEQQLALVVRGGQLDPASSSYSFELVNNYSKPVLGWTMTIEHKGSNGGIRQFYEPSSCSLVMPPLPPAGVLHCKVEVNRWNTAADTPEVARVTSVLFADGTAAGDLELLDATIEKHWSTYRETGYWRKRVQDLRSQSDLVAALQTLQREVRGEAPVLPDHDGYSRAAISVRQELIATISNGLQQINDRRFSAQQVFDALRQQMEIRESAEGLRTNMFPCPQQRLWTAAAFRPSTRELRNPLRLTVLRFEENDHVLRMVIKNDSGRPLSSWGFQASAAGGEFGPSASRGLGGTPIQPGWVDVLELEPTPPPSYRLVSLGATFGDSSAKQTGTVPH